MSLGEEIARALTGGRGGRDTFGGKLEAIRATYPSRKAMARGIRIPESTLRRWEREGVSSKVLAARAGTVDAAYRAAILNRAVMERWRANGMVIHVTGVPLKGGSNRSGTRSLDKDKLDLKAGTGDKVVDKFMAGDNAGAAAAFVAGIQDQWYHDVMFGEWLDDLDVGADDESDYSVSVSGAA